MKFVGFRVTNYRNIHDSGHIEINAVTAFVGQNESGKSNLFDALYRVNPFISDDTYNIDEDWPVDDWGNKKDEEPVCEAHFELTPEEITDLYEHAKIKEPTSEGASTEDDSVAQELVAKKIKLPKQLKLIGTGYYGCEPDFSIGGEMSDTLDEDKVDEWGKQNAPKFVYIPDYDLSGARVELDQLKSRLDSTIWNELSNADQTIKIILDLAKININEFIEKGTTPKGRTIRSFDKRAASAYLSKQFSKLWTQKNVDFDIDIDGTTLNIFARDKEIGMPVRLERRSTGFRWYVSFAWKFTHASSGEYKNCILLLEEPGIHLHYSGQRDLINIFNRLSEDNTVLYTTHLSSMIDLSYPERVRIVETDIENHAVVKAGVVSSQRAPMAVIELSLGLTGDMSSMLGNRQNLIVEGGVDALILHKLSALMIASESEGLSSRIYLWPARSASKTPMYAAFAIGQRWDAAVLLDTDNAGNEAKRQIDEILAKEQAEEAGLKFSNTNDR